MMSVEAVNFAERSGIPSADGIPAALEGQGPGCTLSSKAEAAFLGANRPLQ